MIHLHVSRAFAHLSYSRGDREYRASVPKISPWSQVPGWNVHSVFHDPMHVLYLGTCRDMYGSCLGYWLREGYDGGDGDLSTRLRRFSIELKSESKKNQRLV